MRCSPATWTLAVASMPFTFIQALPLNAGTLQQPTLTVSGLEVVAPESKSCIGAQPLSECRTATEALPYIKKSFSTYQITSVNWQAAVLSTIAFESDEFKYQKNQNGAPGQGTRNMQTAKFNLLYAQSLPQLLPKISSALQSASEALNLLVGNDEYDFGSGAWFLATQCSPSVGAALNAGGVSGFMAYLDCIGTTSTPDRQAYWERACKALGAL